MGLRTKGGGKNKGSRKRKSNVWDDAEPKTKQGAMASENEVKIRNSSSMMGQWKTRKIAERTKERHFLTLVEEKKRVQWRKYEETRGEIAHAICKTNEAVEEEIEAVEVMEESECDSDKEDGLDGMERNMLYKEFVKTFTVEPSVEEEEEEEEEEGEEEEVLVDDDIEKEQETEEEEEKKEDRENEEQVAAMEKDDEEQVKEQDEEEEEDPYRRRYLLSSFSEQEAKKFNAQVRRFTNVDLPTFEPKTYDVTYRNGASEDIEGVAGVVVTPQMAVTKKPYVRSRLKATWKRRGVDAETVLSKGSVEYTLWQQLSAYTDVFFAGQTLENTAKLRRLSAMHVLNHVLKARDTVTRNNERIKKRDSGKTDEEVEKEYRDQGFCRASVLVLLPLRSAAVAFVTHLLELLPATVETFHNKDRFFSEFGSVVNKDDLDAASTKDAAGQKEWQRVFDEGNNDDCFQLGLSFSRKAVRFYSEYHHADVIVASPLGLRHQLGDEVALLDEAETSPDIQLSSDFLSTIEVCIVDSASLMAMQNLDHLRTVLRATNLPPKEAPHADFARVREWNLAFLGSYFRQTVVFAHGVEPGLNAVVNKTCRNLSGLVKFVRRYDLGIGSPSISRVVPKIKQIFQRVDVNFSGHLGAMNEVEIRFAYFKKHVFEPLLEHPRKHVLIFIPCYFDYVRIRNLFHDVMTQKVIQSVQCCEYTSSKQVARARTSFFHGHCHVMLYTERFHFYHQYEMRGIDQVIWYGVPVMEEFYPEMMNRLPSNGNSSIALFSRLDLLRMQRIVGNKRAEHMCQPKAPKPTFLFC